MPYTLDGWTVGDGNQAILAIGINSHEIAGALASFDDTGFKRDVVSEIATGAPI